MTTENDLKACPFCPDGGEPFIEAIGNAYSKQRGYDVGCKKCRFKKSIRVIRQTIEWAKAEAISVWNTRPADSAVSVDVQELVNRCVEKACDYVPCANPLFTEHSPRCRFCQARKINERPTPPRPDSAVVWDEAKFDVWYNDFDWKHKGTREAMFEAYQYGKCPTPAPSSPNFPPDFPAALRFDSALKELADEIAAPSSPVGGGTGGSPYRSGGADIDHEAIRSVKWGAAPSEAVDEGELAEKMQDIYNSVNGNDYTTYSGMLRVVTAIRPYLHAPVEPTKRELGSDAVKAALETAERLADDKGSDLQYEIIAKGVLAFNQIEVEAPLPGDHKP